MGWFQLSQICSFSLSIACRMLRCTSGFLSLPSICSSVGIIDTSRRRRIARGSGCQPSDISQLVKNFEPMRNMMKAMSGQSLTQRMKMGTQFSQMMAGGGVPKLKSTTKANRRVLSKKDRRKKRRRR